MKKDNKKELDEIREVKDTGMDYKSLNEILKTGNILLKLVLAFSVLAIAVLVLYLIDKTSVLVTLGKIIGVLSPLFIGIFLSWLLEPFINYFVKNKVSRRLATFVVYLVLIFCIILIISLIVPEFISQLNELIRKIPDFLTSINTFITDIFKNFSSASFDTTAMKDNVLESINKFVNNLSTNNLSVILDKFSSSIKVLSNIVVGLLVGIYLSLDFGKLNKYIKMITPTRFHDDLNVLKHSFNTMLRSYVSGTLLSCLFVFIFTLIGLLFSGISSPLLFAVFCAITNIIPYFGPYIGGIPVVVVGFATSPVTGIICLITVIIVQFLDGNILNPIIVGKAVSLHPITIMLSLLVFEYFFGIMGMILATPIVATAKIIVIFFNNKYHFMSKLTND
ncbi:MAG: AI-2E family transporter [Bacilli bacterium]|nr:AI-2E family transporter [Bacilli bacterium]